MSTEKYDGKRNKLEICMWCGVPSSFLQTEADREYRVQEMAEAGFTVAELAYDAELNKEMLRLCEKYGLKGSVFDFRIQKVLVEAQTLVQTQASAEAPESDELLAGIVQDYHNSPALLNYHVFDEPTDDRFESLSLIVSKAKQLDPHHETYINLLPICSLGTVENYERHVRNFVETVKPEIISYDHYSFSMREVDKLDTLPEAIITKENRERNGWEGKIYEKYNRGGFFDNLEVIRRLAREYQLPWMNIIMVVEHWNYRYLNEAELRWEVFQSLAYGPDRISYFTYWTPTTSEAWTYHHALIQADGTRDEHYDMVSRINRDLKVIAKELEGSISTAVYHIGEEADTTVTHYDGQCADILNIDAETLTAGFFDKDGTELILLANKDIECEQSVTVAAAKGVSIAALNVESGDWEALPSVNGLHFTEMSAGNAVLIKLIK